MMTSSPRILYLTPAWPHDQSFGGQLRALHIGRALKQIGNVTLTVVSSDVASERTFRRTAAEFGMDRPVQVKLLHDRALFQRLRRGFDSRFLNVHGCVADDADRQRIMSRFGDFDLIWVLNARTPNILNLWQWPRSVLDISDVPSTFQRTVWQNGENLQTKLKAYAQMRLLKRRELRLTERFTILSVCSDADREYLGGSDRIHVIPNGFERPQQVPARNPSIPPRIGFIGLYSYEPNYEGMQWFARECWPAIKRQIPNARLRMAGKDTDGPLRLQGPDIDALGFVDDPAAEIATWSAMVVPIRSGAGTRVKIADAFSRKCPVVATRLGAFGYGVQSGRELLLADDPVEFANGCMSLIRDPAAGSDMAECAWRKFLANWTWEAIAPRVWKAAEDSLRRNRDRQAPAAALEEVS